jgi:hypothetical protein
MISSFVGSISFTFVFGVCSTGLFVFVFVFLYGQIIPRSNARDNIMAMIEKAKIIR